MIAEVDDYGTICTHSEISGVSPEDCVVIGYRHEFERPMNPHEMESWVIWPTGDAGGNRIVSYPFGIVGWLSGVWLSPNRTVYVCDLEGKIYVYPLATLDAQAWTPAVTYPAGTFIHGIWGLDDDNVYAWAHDREGTFILHGSGASWTRRPSPDFEVILVRGSSPTHLLAAGSHGELARWDGSTWSEVPIEAGRSVSGMYVVDEDHFWLSSETGQLFEGSANGVSERARTPGFAPLADVTVWNGEVWLAGRGRIARPKCAKTRASTGSAFAS